MSDRKRDMAVGLTALAGLVVLALLLMIFGKVPGWIKGGYLVRVELPHASGLTEGSRAKLAGIDIGSVTRVQLQTPASRGVLLTVRIREEIQLPQGIKVSVYAPFIGGSAVLEFDVSHLPDDPSQPPLPTDGSVVLKGDVPNLASAFAKELQSSFEKPLEQFDKLSGTFDQLSQEWVRVGKNLNLLLEPRTIAEVEAGKPANLNSTLARADQRLDELQKVIGGINDLVNDPQFRQDLQQTMANAKTATQKIGALAEGARENVDTLTKRYVAVADDLSGAIASMRQTLEQARAGQGTLGKFVQDPALYNNLNDAAGRLNKALDEFKLLLEKWKAEGLPVHF